MDLLALIHVHICISCCLTARAFTHHGRTWLDIKMSSQNFVQSNFWSESFVHRSQLLYVNGHNLSSKVLHLTVSTAVCASSTFFLGSFCN
jgi:hypothetical protein